MLLEFCHQRGHRIYLTCSEYLHNSSHVARLDSSQRSLAVCFSRSVREKFDSVDLPGRSLIQ